MYSLKPLVIATVISLSSITAQAFVSQEEVSNIYTATFDRVPDSAGLEYWIESGLTIEEIASSFFDQDETKEKYPEETTTTEFINAIYQNLFSRVSQESGLIYWSSELESGAIAKSNFILAIMNGAQDNDALILGKKQEVSLNFLSGSLLEEEAQEALQLINYQYQEAQGQDFVDLLDLSYGYAIEGYSSYGEFVALDYCGYGYDLYRDSEHFYGEFTTDGYTINMYDSDGGSYIVDTDDGYIDIGMNYYIYDIDTDITVESITAISC